MPERFVAACHSCVVIPDDEKILVWSVCTLKSICIPEFETKFCISK
jgi:hypothetical protein